MVDKQPFRRALTLILVVEGIDQIVGALWALGQQLQIGRGAEKVLGIVDAEVVFESQLRPYCFQQGWKEWGQASGTLRRFFRERALQFLCLPCLFLLLSTAPEGVRSLDCNVSKEELCSQIIVCGSYSDELNTNFKIKYFFNKISYLNSDRGAQDWANLKINFKKQKDKKR